MLYYETLFAFTGQRTDLLNLRYKEWVSAKRVKEGIPLFLNQGFSLFLTRVKPHLLIVRCFKKLPGLDLNACYC